MDQEALKKMRDELESDLVVKENALQAAQEAYDKAQESLEKFDSVFSPQGEEGTARKKPGPKAGSRRKATPSRAAQGRREVAEGSRPNLKTAIMLVMGSDVCNANNVFEMLKEKDWLPNSSDPRLYIGYTLSSSKENFDRIENKRGFYKVKPEKLAEARAAFGHLLGSSPKTEPQKAEEAVEVKAEVETPVQEEKLAPAPSAAPKGKPKKAPASVSSEDSTDAILQSAGFDTTAL